MAFSTELKPGSGSRPGGVPPAIGVPRDAVRRAQRRAQLDQAFRARTDQRPTKDMALNNPFGSGGSTSARDLYAGV